jgi:hypothetical protein
MKNNELTILWTNDNPETSELMVMMYATNSMKLNLWDKLTVVIWGATSKLVAENTMIQELITEAKNAGVIFSACQSCAEKLGTKDTLQNLGIELKYWGSPLTEIIKNNENLITI